MILGVSGTSVSSFFSLIIELIFFALVIEVEVVVVGGVVVMVVDGGGGEVAACLALEAREALVAFTRALQRNAIYFFGLGIFTVYAHQNTSLQNTKNELACHRESAQVGTCSKDMLHHHHVVEFQGHWQGLGESCWLR